VPQRDRSLNRGSQQRGGSGGGGNRRSDRRGYPLNNSNRPRGGERGARQSPSGANGRRTDRQTRDYQSRPPKRGPSSSLPRGRHGGEENSPSTRPDPPRSALHIREQGKLHQSDSSGDSTPASPASSNSSTDFVKKQRKEEVQRPLSPISDNEWGDTKGGPQGDDGSLDRQRSRSRSKSTMRNPVGQSSKGSRSGSIPRKSVSSERGVPSRALAGPTPSQSNNAQSSSDGEQEQPIKKHVPQIPLKKRVRHRESRPPPPREPTPSVPSPINLEDFKRAPELPYLKGKLEYLKGNDNLQIKGKWAMSYTQFVRSGIKSDFSFTLDHDVPVSQIPQSGYYSGWIKMKELKGPKRYPEKNIWIGFEKNSKGDYNIRGSGANTFGAFIIDGKSTEDGKSVEIYRTYLQSPNNITAEYKEQKKKHVKKADRGGSRMHQDVKQDSAASPNPKEVKKSTRLEDVKKVRTFLTKLSNFDSDGVFGNPVDPIAQGCPNYPEVVKNPMDLSTIKKKLSKNKYKSKEEVLQDVKLMIDNSLFFNKIESCPVRSHTLKMEEYYKKQYRKEFGVSSEELDAILSQAVTPLTDGSVAPVIKEAGKESDSEPVPKKPRSDPEIAKANEKIKKAMERLKKEKKDPPPEKEPSGGEDSESEEEAEFPVRPKKKGERSHPAASPERGGEPKKKSTKEPGKKKEADGVPKKPAPGDGVESGETPVPKTPAPKPTTAAAPQKKIQPPVVAHIPGAREILNSMELEMEEKSELIYAISEDVPEESTPEMKTYLETLCPLNVDQEVMEEVEDVIQKALEGQAGVEDVDIDIENLPIPTLRQLQKMVNQFQKKRKLPALKYYIQAKKRAKVRAKHAEEAAALEPKKLDTEKPKDAGLPPKREKRERPEVGPEVGAEACGGHKGADGEPRSKKNRPNTPRASPAKEAPQDTKDDASEDETAAKPETQPTADKADSLDGKEAEEEGQVKAGEDDNVSRETVAEKAVEATAGGAEEGKPEEPEMEEEEMDFAKPEEEEEMPEIDPAVWKNFNVCANTTLMKSDSTIVLNELWLSAKKERQERLAIMKEKAKHDQLRLEFQKWLRHQDAERLRKQKKKMDELRAIEEQKEKEQRQRDLEALQRKRQKEREMNENKPQEVDLFQAQKAIDEMCKVFGLKGVHLEGHYSKVEQIEVDPGA